MKDLHSSKTRKPPETGAVELFAYIILYDPRNGTP